MLTAHLLCFGCILLLCFGCILLPCFGFILLPLLRMHLAALLRICSQFMGKLLFFVVWKAHRAFVELPVSVMRAPEKKYEERGDHV